ncbi:SDR family oxidoreductase [Nocardia mexicana]|uniref:SDR family oxidoreductase n=1 Tax=Nocardia mexicana TaxID=279262 RepID=UPI0035A23D9E
MDRSAELRQSSTPVESVRGDIRKPSFGLQQHLPDEIGAIVNAILHRAGATVFNARSLAKMDSMSAVPHTLSRWQVPLTYVSTVYVAGTREGTVTENDYDHKHQFTNGYERTEFRAEALVRAVKGLRWGPPCDPRSSPAIPKLGDPRLQQHLYDDQVDRREHAAHNSGQMLRHAHTGAAGLRRRCRHRRDRRFDEAEGLVFHAVGAPPNSLGYSATSGNNYETTKYNCRFRTAPRRAAASTPAGPGRLERAGSDSVGGGRAPCGRRACPDTCHQTLNVTTLGPTRTYSRSDDTHPQ